VKDYECHITVEASYSSGQRKFLEEIGEANGWKTSFIEGDPDLGKGSRFFFTAHYNNLDAAFEHTEALDWGLRMQGLVVARKKIEEVLMDTKADTWRAK
jgi:hypothetical protein